MDIQVSSNFERVLYDYFKKDENKIKTIMNDLKFKGLFNIEKNILNKIKEDFDATC